MNCDHRHPRPRVPRVDPGISDAQLGACLLPGRWHRLTTRRNYNPRYLRYRNGDIGGKLSQVPNGRARGNDDLVDLSKKNNFRPGGRVRDFTTGRCIRYHRTESSRVRVYLDVALKFHNGRARYQAEEKRGG